MATLDWFKAVKTVTVPYSEGPYRDTPKRVRWYSCHPGTMTDRSALRTRSQSQHESSHRPEQHTIILTVTANYESVREATVT